MDKGWVSWAERVLVPDIETRKSHKEDNSDTERNKRWSIGTVRNFLDMTPVPIANEAITSWWQRHPMTNWNVIKYADNDDGLGAIRYIGSSRYRLYKNDDFVSDLSNTDFGSFEIRDSAINENRMVLRVSQKDPLPIDGVNVFAGFHIYNSENGSSTIGIKHLIFDKICSNGLIIVLDSKQILNQRHCRFEPNEFRNKIVDISKFLPQIHDSATKLVGKLINMKLEMGEVEAIMRMYQDRTDASNSFIEEAASLSRGKYRSNAWGVLSAITDTAQRYNWDTRITHEEQASELIKLIEDGSYKKYLSDDGKKEEPN
jgi:hypothetical protein